ncbi:MAG: RNA polymerase subunit sigma [Deltaproteobacteria bacterium]|nr:RNA polymerase subunit sigma [Deltaproteobacteria bacterium]
MSATETVPDVDVWGWTQETNPDLGGLLETKKAILIHAPLRQKLEERLGEMGMEPDDDRLAGLSFWLLAQYHRAWPHLQKADAKDALVAFAQAECCLKGSVAENGGTPTRRPDLAAKLLEKHPGLSTPRVYAMYLDALLFDNDTEAARAALDNAPGEIKNGPHGSYVEGRLAEEEGDYRAAKSHLLKAIEMDPGHRGALLRLAYQHDLGGDDDEALEYYKRLSGLRPLDVHATLNYGVLLEDRERFADALAQYRTVLRAFPNHSRAQAYYRDAHGSLNMIFDEDIERRHDKRNQLLRIPISDFELSVRARNCLSKMSIETLGDLVIKTEAELLAYKNFGETSLSEIKVLLESKGLRLGMDLNEDPIPEAPPKKELPPVEVPPGVDPAVLTKVLADLELSVRCRKALAQLKAVTVGDIMRHTEQELLSLKNFGQTSLVELKARLSEFGVGLRQS